MSTIYEGSLENWGCGEKCNMSTMDTIALMMMAIAAAEREGNTKVIDAIVCTVISEALFGDREMEPEEIKFVYSAWEELKDFYKEGSWRNGAD